MNIEPDDRGIVVQLRSVIAGEHAGHSERYIATFLWMFLGFLYVSIASQWFTVSSRDKVFTEYTYQVIQAAANEQRPAKEVRALILIKAEDLSVPIQGDAIQIDGNGRQMKAAVHYKADISMPIVNQPVFRITFQHESRL